MKIQDIVVEYETKSQVAYRQQAPKSRTASSTTLGTGLFSRVNQDPRLPQEVLKTTYYHGTRDGYQVFVDALINDPRFRKNPHFPRISSVKKIVHPKNEPTYMVRMESLKPLHDLSLSQLTQLWHRYFDRDVPKDLEAETIADMLSDVNDPQFQAAYRLSQQLAQQHNLVFDLHEENVMVRLGPQGGVLVITDPVR